MHPPNGRKLVNINKAFLENCMSFLPLSNVLEGPPFGFDRMGISKEIFEKLHLP
jgi:hypothetical protein